MAEIGGKFRHMTDPFRDFEHAGWERVAQAYADAWPGLTAQFGERLLDAAGVAEGMRVLDVASGPGVVTRAAVRRGARAGARLLQRDGRGGAGREPGD
jgi:ubiquinone/menaquinone biosynthesis C-methylase UbiE